MAPRNLEGGQRAQTLLAKALLLLSTIASLNRPVAGADLNGTYIWKQLPLYGGGWVTGGVVHPSVKDLVYMRTDVGGR